MLENVLHWIGWDYSLYITLFTRIGVWGQIRGKNVPILTSIKAHPPGVASPWDILTPPMLNHFQVWDIWSLMYKRREPGIIYIMFAKQDWPTHNDQTWITKRCLIMSKLDMTWTHNYRKRTTIAIINQTNKIYLNEYWSKVGWKQKIPLLK